MVNKIENLVYEVCRDEDEDTSLFPEREYADGIRDGANRMLDRVRASLENWPHDGCDKEIAESIDRICQEYYKAREKEKWMTEFNKNLVKSSFVMSEDERKRIWDAL